MAKYTWDEVNKLIQNNGLFFSDADLKLAQSNPDAGMSLVNYKIDYKNATTDDQKALANAGAEKIRSDYGNYTGGSDGSKFYLNEPSPMTFNFGTQGGSQSSDTGQTGEYKNPYGEYKNPYADQQQAALDKIINREDFQNPYADQQQAALNAVLNREKFSYDPAQDIAWQNTKKQYLREADRAVQDTMGNAAALTGGMASTAAATAASQAGDYYRTQLTDRLGDFEQNAYNRYMDDIGLNYQQLDALNNMSDREKQDYIDALGLDFDTLSAITNLSQQARDEYDTDRNFAYNQWTDELGFQTDKSNIAYEQEQYAREYADSTNDELARLYLSLYDSTLNKEYLNKALERIKEIGK